VKEMGSRFKAVHGKPQIVIAKKKRIKMGDRCEKYGFKVFMRRLKFQQQEKKNQDINNSL
jgi:hypothetical protein